MAALFAIVLAAGVTSGPLPSAVAEDRATFPGANGRIAYTKVWYVKGQPGPDERSDIFSVRPNGTGNKRLTFTRGASNPKWSPSGGRIAFERADAVWVMKSDGSAKKELTDGHLVGWMPAGGQVLVVRWPDARGVDPTWVLHTVATGEEEELPIDLPLVADFLEPPYDGYDEWEFVSSPTLSPDGELLALMLWRSDYGDDQYEHYHGSIYTVRLDGSELTRVPRYTYSWGSPAWAPDGSELVVWHSEPRGYCSDGLASIGLDGSGGSVSIEKPCSESDPAWSPNMRKIVFVSAQGRLQISNLDGSRITTVLPKTPGVERYDPDWRSVD